MSDLTDLIDRIEDQLSDSGNVNWTTSELTNALRLALSRLNQMQPRQLEATVTLAADGREIDISAVSPAPLYVTAVWDDYDASDPVHPPRWVSFEQRESGILILDTSREPETGDVERLFYTAAHTIDTLDGASATTCSAQQLSALVIGAAAFAAYARSVYLMESATLDKQTPLRFQVWSNQMLKYFDTLLLPRWSRSSWIMWT